MSQVNLVKLASEGRAHSASRVWTGEELEALILLERERGLQRIVAAEYVRNGILSVEAYDLALEKGFEPKSLEQVAEEAIEAMRSENSDIFGSAKPAKKPKTAKRVKK